MKLNSPEMKKSLKADADAFNANTKKMNTFGKELDNATDKQKDANFELEKLQESYKKDIASGASQRDLDNAIMKAKTKVLNTGMAKTKAEGTKKDFDAKYKQESLAALDRIGNNVLKVSPEELETRRLFQESLTIEKEQAALLRADPLRQDQADAADANIKVKEEKEKERREKANTNILKKGFANLSSAFVNFKENAMKAGVTALKGGMLVLLYFAIAKFLQSPLFMDVIDFFSSGGPLMIALKVVGVILTAFLAKFLLVKYAKILTSKLLGVLNLTKKSGMDMSKISKTMGKTSGKGIAALRKGMGSIGKNLSKGAKQLMSAGGKGMTFLRTGIMSIGGGLKKYGLMLGKMVLRSLLMINPFVLLGAAIAGIGLLIYNYWDEITAFFGSIGTSISNAVSSIGTKIGTFFSDLFKPVTDLFIKIKNAMAGYYNSVATSAFGKFIGMTPIAIAGAAEPAEAPQFVKNLQGPTVADRANKMKVADSATQYVINNNAVNSVSTTGPTVQQNSTRYVKDQGGVFASNNA